MLAVSSVVCLLLTATQVDAAIKEVYTTNAICERNNCINPIFPGLEDLHQLSEEKWVCSSLRDVAPVMGFCQGAVNYDPSLPVPGGSESLENLVRRQDNAASTAFFYHMTGMGFEAWDYQKPRYSDNDCVKSVWRMVCYTHFPRAPVGCQDGLAGDYLRPCQSSCQNYIEACQVECCDESVQCVFTHQKRLSATSMIETTGYLPHDGPSSLCTGAAHRSRSPMSFILFLVLMPVVWASSPAAEDIAQTASRLGAKKMLWLMALVAIAMSVQGCDFDVPEHHVGNWRGEPDYLIDHQFIPPGGSSRDAVLNSCSLDNLSPTLQCSGRGTCKTWTPDDLKNRLAFCECEVGWADPECKTQRKSQTTAFFISIFFGYFGMDQFYLGHIIAGTIKLLTLGGLGFWWALDIVRIGSAPVHTNTYRVAADLPHWVFVLFTVSFACLLGFTVVYFTTLQFRKQKRKEALLLQLEEENRSAGEVPPYSNLYESNLKMPIRPAYGSVNLYRGVPKGE